ncbi:hypothetical protein OG21DRAFT_1526784 [Imleria badia]|nr:hypothetical protein OG21DRAFT_1526784 [Imleria badia]
MARSKAVWCALWFAWVMYYRSSGGFLRCPAAHGGENCDAVQRRPRSGGANRSQVLDAVQKSARAHLDSILQEHSRFSGLYNSRARPSRDILAASDAVGTSTQGTTSIQTVPQPSDLGLPGYPAPLDPVIATSASLVHPNDASAYHVANASGTAQRTSAWFHNQSSHPSSSNEPYAGNSFNGARLPRTYQKRLITLVLESVQPRNGHFSTLAPSVVMLIENMRRTSHSKSRIVILEKSDVGSTGPSNSDSRVYWDWVDPKVDVEGIPSLFYAEELTILGTIQKSVTVPNPLTHFTFLYIPRDFSDDTRVSAIGDERCPSDARCSKSLGRGYRLFYQTGEYVPVYVFLPKPTGRNIQALQAALKQNAVNARTSTGMLFSFPLNGNSAGGNGHTVGALRLDRQLLTHLSTRQGLADYDDRLDLTLSGFTVDGAEQKWTLARGTYSVVYNQKVEDEGGFGSLVPFRHSDGKYWTRKETRFHTLDAHPKYYFYEEFFGIKVDKALASLEEREEARENRQHELLYSVTVSVREDKSLCKACADRREADSIVRGVITIPSHIINGNIVHSNVPQSKRMDETVGLTAQAFSGTLVCVNGHTIASAQGSVATSPVQAVFQ